MSISYLYLLVKHQINIDENYPLCYDGLPEGEYCFKLAVGDNNCYSYWLNDKVIALPAPAVDIIEATINRLSLEELNGIHLQGSGTKAEQPCYELEIKYGNSKRIKSSARPGSNEKIINLAIHLKTIMDKANSHRVDINGCNSAYGLNRDYFVPGEWVRFKVILLTDTSVYVNAEGVSLDEEGMEGSSRIYSFIMPANDVKVNITHRSTMMNPMFRGDAPGGFMGMAMGRMMQFNGKLPPNPQTSASQGKKKFCSECGAPNKDAAKFCSMCGRKF